MTLAEWISSVTGARDRLRQQIAAACGRFACLRSSQILTDRPPHGARVLDVDPESPPRFCSITHGPSSTGRSLRVDEADSPRPSHHFVGLEPVPPEKLSPDEREAQASLHAAWTAWRDAGRPPADVGAWAGTPREQLRRLHALEPVLRGPVVSALLALEPGAPEPLLWWCACADRDVAEEEAAAPTPDHPFFRVSESAKEARQQLARLLEELGVEPPWWEFQAVATSFETQPLQEAALLEQVLDDVLACRREEADARWTEDARAEAPAYARELIRRLMAIKCRLGDLQGASYYAECAARSGAFSDDDLLDLQARKGLLAARDLKGSAERELADLVERLRRQNQRLAERLSQAGPVQPHTAPSLRTRLYECVSETERLLHAKIRDGLIRRFGREDENWWWEGVPEGVRAECAHRRQVNADRHSTDYHYTYVLDLWKILSRHWGHFSTSLPKPLRDKKALEDTFQFFNDARNAIYHPIKPKRFTPEDGKRLKGFLEQIRSWDPGTSQGSREGT